MIMQILDSWQRRMNFADPLVGEDAVPYVPLLCKKVDRNRQGLKNFALIVVVMRQEGLDELDTVQLVRYCSQ